MRLTTRLRRDVDQARRGRADVPFVLALLDALAVDEVRAAVAAAAGPRTPTRPSPPGRGQPTSRRRR